MSDQTTIEEQEQILDPAAPYNAGDRKHVRAKEKAKKAVDTDLNDVMDALLQKANGRKWLAWVLNDLCALNRQTENAAFDSNALHWREGQRAVGLGIQKQALAVSRVNYLTLLAEHLN